MPSQLKPEVVRERLREYVGVHYLLLISVIKGVAIWIAADVLIQMWDKPSFWPRLAFVAGASGASLISYVTWARGIVMTNEKYNVFDAAFPLFMGLIEILLFMVLIPNDDHPYAWRHWYLLIS